MNFSDSCAGFTIQTRMYSAIAVVLGLLILVGGVGVVGMRANHQTVAIWQESATEAQTMATCTQPWAKCGCTKGMALNAGRPSDVDGY